MNNDYIRQLGQKLTESDYNALLSSLDQTALVSMTDEKGTIIYANKKFVEISKYTLQELVGQNHRILKSGLQPQAFFENLWRTISSGKVWRGEITNRAKDGTYYCVDTSIAPIIGTNDKPQKYISVRFLITDKKELEAKRLQELKELENAKIAARNVLEDLSIEKAKVEIAMAKEEAILLSVGDGLIATDEKGNITLINKTAETLLGKKKEEIIGKVFSEIIAIEDEDGVSVPLEKRPASMALAGDTTTTTGPVYYYVRPDKTKFPVAIMATPIVLDGKIIGTIEIFRDITKEKEIDKTKSEFVSLASHQLKTPPTAIKLLTERLLGDKIGTLTEKQKEYLNDIRSENQRSIELVNALLNVSRIEMGAFTIQLTEKNICAVVQSVLSKLKSVIDKKQLKLEEVYLEKNTAVLIDEPMFRMVVSNLVVNAVNYTADGGALHVECKEAGKGQALGGKFLAENSFVVVVSDTGYGIPKLQQDELFTKFFRADNVREKHPDGTGLGLYIAKSILGNSGGSIWFNSEENKGTTFYVAIPMTGMKAEMGKKELVDI